MTVKLLTKHHLEFLSLKGAAQACLSLHMSKCQSHVAAIFMLLVLKNCLNDILFDLILYIPSTIFQLNRDRSSWVEPVLN